ncbi:hypothetical protein HZC09_00795 [Candidatus Micrarchaeota archaeon]|nr:hypothetical protein [Candidatus Micrarchaeota archaeon]
MQKTVAIEKVGHSPTLNTVLMVEEALQKAGEPLTIAELKRDLPRKVMHSTIVSVLGYLQTSGKILLTTKGIVWIFAPRAEIEAMKKRGIEL